MSGNCEEDTVLIGCTQVKMCGNTKVTRPYLHTVLGKLTGVRTQGTVTVESPECLELDGIG